MSIEPAVRQHVHSAGYVIADEKTKWLAQSCVTQRVAEADQPISIAPAVEPAIMDRRGLGPLLAGWESCCAGEEAITAVCSSIDVLRTCRGK